MKICIVNFNTNELTNNLLKSIFLNVKSFDYKINIFDNSDIDKFRLCSENALNSNKIEVIDNTEGKYIDFNKVLEDNVDKQHYSMTACMDQSHHGTLKHTYTIDWLLQNIDDEFVLFDSDTILKTDIDFIDNSYATACSICYQEPKWKNRCLPFIQYFNINMLKCNNIRYFDKNRILFGANPANNLIYDTGASFYEDLKIKSLPIKEIDYNKYIVHFCCGSWLNRYKNEKLLMQKMFYQRTNR